jgi:Mn-dependent DtxR family transcriptional regulator
MRIPVTQAELAEAANLSRNAAGTILRELAAKGLIETDYRGVVLRDPEGLQRLGAGAAP